MIRLLLRRIVGAPATDMPTALCSEGLFAEVVKHGIIEGGDAFDALEVLAPHPLRKWPWETIVGVSIRVKAMIVADDRVERGARETLNRGHTVGHAIEHVSGYRTSHGAAIAMGLRAAGLLALRTGRFSTSEHLRVLSLLALLRLPFVSPVGDINALLAAMANDKKARAGNLRFVLPRNDRRRRVRRNRSHADGSHGLAASHADPRRTRIPLTLVPAVSDKTRTPLLVTTCSPPVSAPLSASTTHARTSRRQAHPPMHPRCNSSSRCFHTCVRRSSTAPLRTWFRAGWNSRSGRWCARRSVRARCTAMSVGDPRTIPSEAGALSCAQGFCRQVRRAARLRCRRPATCGVHRRTLLLLARRSTGKHRVRRRDSARGRPARSDWRPAQRDALPSVPQRLTTLIWEDLSGGFGLETLLRHTDARRAGDRSTLSRAVSALVRAGALRCAASGRLRPPHTQRSPRAHPRTRRTRRARPTPAGAGRPRAAERPGGGCVARMRSWRASRRR